MIAAFVDMCPIVSILKGNSIAEYTFWFLENVWSVKWKIWLLPEYSQFIWIEFS